MIWIALFRLTRLLIFSIIVGLAWLILLPRTFRRVVPTRWMCWGGFHDVTTATGYDWYCKREECQAEWSHWHSEM